MMAFCLLFLLPLFRCFAQSPPSPQLPQQQRDNLISNVGPGDVLMPNLYRWMEQNAHICQNLASPAVFLTEFEAEQFKCLALCGDWDSAKACAKESDKFNQPPNCLPVPDLCLQNFQQEYFSLQFTREVFQTSTNKATATSSTTTVLSSTATEMPTQIGGTSTVAFARFHGMPRSNELQLVDSDLMVVDGEAGGDASSLAGTTTAFPVPASPVPASLLPVPDFPTPSPLLLCPAADVDVVSCAWWKRVGECARNSRFMQRVCRRACGFCK
uniref:ShKT domain-containing protein n=1 Tax=Globodera rostochiensis TaxID=31243 RepID=A0A914H424_GLORO